MVDSSTLRITLTLILKNLCGTHPALTAIALCQTHTAHQIPTLLIDGCKLTQSLSIMEYLEETRPSAGRGRLLPTDDFALRAKIRQVRSRASRAYADFHSRAHGMPDTGLLHYL